VRILAKACAVLLSAAAAALAQPVVSPNGMVNAASSVPAGLPNGDVAQARFSRSMATTWSRGARRLSHQLSSPHLGGT